MYNGVRMEEILTPFSYMGVTKSPERVLEALSGKSFLQIKYLTVGRDNSTIYLVILYIFTVNHEFDIDAYFMKKGIAYEDELQQIMEVTD